MTLRANQAKRRAATSTEEPPKRMSSMKAAWAWSKCNVWVVLTFSSSMQEKRSARLSMNWLCMMLAQSAEKTFDCIAG